MTLLENKELISKHKSVADIFNDYFANTTNLLGIEETRKSTVSTYDIDNLVEIAITKYSLHTSIRKIRENFHLTQKFEFRPCSAKDVMIQIERLD